MNENDRAILALVHNYRKAAGDAFARKQDDLAARYREAADTLEQVAHTLPPLPGPTPRSEPWNGDEPWNARAGGRGWKPTVVPAADPSTCRADDESMPGSRL